MVRADDEAALAVSEPPHERLPSRTLPVAVTALLIAATLYFYLPLLSSGGFRIFDEFHTLDRTTAFARQGDWFTVYSLQEPSFKKPPLQYWLSAALLEAGTDQLTALRLPSFVFALGALAATALLAAAVMPANLWAMPGAVLLLSCSAMFWQHALSAMLDTGAVFFSTLSLAAAILALKHPRWWYVAGTAIALGSLQKAWIGLPLVALWLAFLGATSRWHGLNLRDIARGRAFRISVAIALAGSLFWPVAQTLLHGADALDEFFGDQMIDRFLPGEARTGTRGPGDLAALLIGGEPSLRWPAIMALLWLPWRVGRMDLLPLPLIFALFAAAMLLAGGHVTARYTLIFLPLLAVALAVVILSLVPRPLFAAPLFALIAWAAGGPIRSAGELALAMDPSYAAQIGTMTAAGEIRRPGERLVICTTSGGSRLIPALASHYAAGGRPFVRLVNERSLRHNAERGLLDGPFLGVCTPEDLSRFADAFEGLEILAERGGYVIWRAKAVR
jgi:4-amino-4-deoxy-L-arabinose transferase-like glycosyltransferase